MSPFVTVGVLTVLWLIVVVPMVVRRNDDVAKDRSITQFGRAMRALGRRSGTRREPLRPGAAVPDAEVWVARTGTAVRRPVPAAQEVAMRPDRVETSAARAAMMARRRRSLTVLVVGALVTTVFALVAGGLVWALSIVFLAGLAGYLLFLRAQATRDRDRRQARRERLGLSPVRGADLAEREQVVDMTRADDTVVRIDDDDIELQTMDTIDLTGLYPADSQPAPAAAERRAS